MAVQSLGRSYRRGLQTMRTLVLSLLLAGSVLGPVWGLDESSSVPPPREVLVAIYVLNIGKVDIITGTFTVDFYLTLKDPQPFEERPFEFMNGRADRLELTWESVDDENRYVRTYRVFATLSARIDLTRFPFDSQTIPIILEPTVENDQAMVYVPYHQEMGVDSANSFAGWVLSGWRAQVTSHYYEIYGEAYSSFRFEVDISKIFFNSLMKTFLPIFFAIFIALSLFFIATEKAITRIEVTSGLLLASALFHITIGNQLPPVTYVTFADKFMFLTYFILLVCMLVNIFVYRAFPKWDKERLQRIERGIIVALFVGTPALYGLLFAFFI